jgi:hypothetical protein
MTKQHAHHWIVEAPEEAFTRWEKLGYGLGTVRKKHRKLKSVCRKCKKIKYHPVDGGIKSFTAKRRGPQRKKGEGVSASWHTPL